MEKYKVVFEFLNNNGEWKESYLSDNGKGFTKEDAEYIMHNLKYDNVCVKRNLRIENL